MRRTVAPPLGEVVRLADGAEDGEVEDEGDDLRAAVERAGDDVVVWGRGLVGDSTEEIPAPRDNK